MAKRRNLPKTKAIFQHWEHKLLSYGREVYNDSTCFACLRRGSVQRCHIKAHSEGGSDKEENLHLLCPNCHCESEMFTGPLYWLWFNNKDIIWLSLYRSRERAQLIGKIEQFMKERIPEKYNACGGDIKKLTALYDDFILSFSLRN